MSTRQVLDRYALYDELASGGMAVVHFARLLGAGGFSRTVVVKRLHAQFAKDRSFSSMLQDEAAVASRIQHPNVVSMLDVVAANGQLLLVEEYVHGPSLSTLIESERAKGGAVPVPICCSIVSGVLAGLHAAHEATDERGEAMHVVHRDVSPQNIVVGIDGVARILDFGIAKAVSRSQTTHEGQIKGKLAYMSPEQLQQSDLDRRTDVFACGIVLWELLSGRRLFARPDPGAIVASVLMASIEPPSHHRREVPPELDAIVLRALERDVERRFPTALAMARALAALPSAPSIEVGDWVRAAAADELARREECLAIIERDSLGEMRAAAPPPPSQVPTLIVEAESVLQASPPALLPNQTQSAGSSRTRLRASLALGLGLLVVAGVGVTLAGRSMVDASKLAGSPSGLTPSNEPTSSVSIDLPDHAAKEPPPTSSPLPIPAALDRKDPAPPRTRSTAAHSAPRPPAGRPNCSPPYYVDIRGHQVFKVECLDR